VHVAGHQAIRTLTARHIFVSIHAAVRLLLILSQTNGFCNWQGSRHTRIKARTYRGTPDDDARGVGLPYFDLF
jgi:hypothetical protein